MTLIFAQEENEIFLWILEGKMLVHSYLVEPTLIIGTPV
jgi:hypothetical protein